MRKSLAVFVILLGAYAAWPYLSLYRIGQDVRHGDVAALGADMDWPQLRSGLKADIAEGIAGVPAHASTISFPGGASADDLPPFGAGFATSVADNVVDRTVTPQRLAGSVATYRAAGAAPIGVGRAFFTGPTRFVVALRVGQDDAATRTVTMRLDLVRAGLTLRWKVTRVWVPAALLASTDLRGS
jgi:hypothetical protein